MKRVSYNKIDYELNELGPKTHFTVVVDLNKFHALIQKFYPTA